MDAVALALAIRRREVTVTRVVEQALATIVKQNPRCHALIEVYARSCRHQAARFDRKLATNSGTLPPFFGVPIAVKDLSFVQGRRTWMGSQAFGPFWSPFNDRSVASLRRAGFILVGKSATSELGALPITEPVHRPPTRNPLDLERSAGGSSGGAAAAVASGMLALAHGADAAGSVRIPAAYCGLYGFKPSRGHVPNPYGLPARGLIYTCGAIARTARDVTALTSVLARSATSHTPRPLRVMCATSTPGVATLPAHVNAVTRVAEHLAELGHDVCDSVPMVHEALGDVSPLYGRLIGDIPVLRPRRLETYTKWLRSQTGGLSRRELAKRQERIQRRIDTWFSAVDVVISPTTAQGPPLVGSRQGRSPQELFHQAFEACAYTAPFNISGQPAGTVPVQYSNSRVPAGVQIAGRRNEDAMVLHLMERCASLASKP